MKEKTIVPTTLLDWPKVIDLLPEQKLLLFSLWAGRYTNGIGIVSNPPLAAMAASVGLSRASLETGLANLHDARCIIWDREADEICIIDWFRFHKFKGVGEQISRREAGKISSSTIQTHLSTHAPWLFESTYPQSADNQSDSPPTPTTKPKLFKKQQQAAGASASDEVVVVFPDNSSTTCRPCWQEDLQWEVAAAAKAGRISDNHGAYAAGILARWKAAGRPSTRKAAANKKHQPDVPSSPLPPRASPTRAAAGIAAARAALQGSAAA